MDATLHALGVLLVQAVPTVLFFLFLTFYLKGVFFKPLAAVLEERRRATEGVRLLAQQALEAANTKGSEFEKALQIARSQIHQEHEALRRRWVEEQAAAVAKARAESVRQIGQAKQVIADEAQKAQWELDAQVEALGEKITASLLKRRAA